MGSEREVLAKRNLSRLSAGVFHELRVVTLSLVLRAILLIEHFY